MRILDAILSLVLIADVAVHLLRWRASRAAQPDAAAIVRTLAAIDPYVPVAAGASACGTCGVACPDQVDVPHDPGCAWKLAQAWVAQHLAEPSR